MARIPPLPGVEHLALVGRVGPEPGELGVAGYRHEAESPEDVDHAVLAGAGADGEGDEGLADQLHNGAPLLLDGLRPGQGARAFVGYPRLFGRLGRKDVGRVPVRAACRAAAGPENQVGALTTTRSRAPVETNTPRGP
jgi:hypothetical protein